MQQATAHNHYTTSCTLNNVQKTMYKGAAARLYIFLRCRPELHTLDPTTPNLKSIIDRT
jgi:hypothetical protein